MPNVLNIKIYFNDFVFIGVGSVDWWYIKYLKYLTVVFYQMSLLQFEISC